MPNAVVDANIIVSVFIAGSRDSTSSNALRRLRQDHTLTVSKAILAEYREVLLRPKFLRHGATEAGVEGFLRRLLVGSVAVMPDQTVADCRDADDNRYLEAALAGGAAVILSGDKDLLCLNPWRGISILRPAEFLARA